MENNKNKQTKTKLLYLIKLKYLSWTANKVTNKVEKNTHEKSLKKKINN